MDSPSETISFSKILSESKRIVRSHLDHFRALAFLFLFPLSFCLFIYPTIQSTFLPRLQSNFPYFTKTPNQYLLFSLLYSIFLSLFSLSAVAAVSYSTYRAFYEEPVNLIDSLKSICGSFFPLLSTALVSELIVFLIFIPFILMLSVYYSSSNYFLIFVIFISLVYVILLIYLQVNWILAYVVVVVESKWGYKPLQRSAYLIKGNRGVALSTILYFAFTSGGIFWAFYGIRWSSSGLFLFIFVVFGSICTSSIMLLSLVANVVLYVYCKDLHEGLPFKFTKNCPLLK